MMLVNHIRSLRMKKGLSQADLAEQIGVTRQAIGSIEACTVVPSTTIALRLARVFHLRVEDLFEEPKDELLTIAKVDATDALWQPGDRVILTGIGSTLTAHQATVLEGYRLLPLPASGIVVECIDAEHVRIERAPLPSAEQTLVIAGCDIGLGLLAQHVERKHHSTQAMWYNADNRQALHKLQLGLAHMAAVHYPTGQPVLHPQVATFPALQRVRFATWRIGFVVARGNPYQFKSVEDLSSGRLRLVNRPQGAGVRTTLDSLLTAHHIPTSAVNGYTREVTGHLQVVDAIATGTADVGITIESAAAVAKLDFIPIHEEQCDLLFPQTSSDEGIDRILSLLHSDSFRWDLTRFGPYDIDHTGELISSTK